MRRLTAIGTVGVVVVAIEPLLEAGIGIRVFTKVAVLDEDMILLQIPHKTGFKSVHHILANTREVNLDRDVELLELGFGSKTG